MGDYEELIELGFEGVDKFADKYHDKMYDHIPRVAPHVHLPFGKPPKQAQQAQNNQQNGQQTRQADRSSRDGRDGRDSASDRNDSRERRRMYEGGDRDYSQSSRGGGNRYSADDSSLVPRGRPQAPYGAAYAVAPYPPQAPYGYPPPVAVAQPYGAYGDPRLGQRPEARRRASSYSPPRRPRRTSPRRRPARSKLPEDDHVTATIVGALAGGLLGSAAKDRSTLSTVGGAVLGGLAARQGEKWYDQYDEKKEEEERRRRRKERDARY